MAAPEWILTDRNDLIHTPQVKTILVANSGSNAAVIITFVNGTSLNYSYADNVTAQSWVDAYANLIGPTPIP